MAEKTVIKPDEAGLAIMDGPKVGDPKRGDTYGWGKCTKLKKDHADGRQSIAPTEVADCLTMVTLGNPS